MDNQAKQVGERLREIRTILEISAAEMAACDNAFSRRSGGS